MSLRATLLDDMLRVDNTEHTQTILFITIRALPNDGIFAKDIEVCLWLLFNVFRVNACRALSQYSNIFNKFIAKPIFTKRLFKNKCE